VPAKPFLAELAAVSRARSIADRHDTTSAMAIPLRAVRNSAIGDRNRSDVHEARWTEASLSFRFTSNFLRTFAAERGGDLGRARIVRTPAGHRTRPHIDRGEYYLFRDRYHLVLKATEGAWLKAGDEDVTMRAGELWWFDNRAVHEAANRGADDHIQLIFDVLNANGKRMLDHAVRTRIGRVRAPASPMA
jgi:Aspartyl/Asparaginyl beta-hydroxylase